MDKFIRTFFAAVAIISFVAVFVNKASADDYETIRVRGVATIAKITNQYALEYMKINPGCAIVVSGGTNCKFDEFLKGNCEIIMRSPWASTNLKNRAAQRGIKLKGEIIGWGGFAFIANKSNPVSDISMDDVKAIFSGSISNWKEIGGANSPINTFVISDKRSAEPGFMEAHILKSAFSKKIIKKISYRSLISSVAGDMNSIGFIRVCDLDKINDSGLESKVKTLGIRKYPLSDPIQPSIEAVNEGDYPLTRPYYLYYNAKSKKRIVRNFVAYCALKNPRPLVIIEDKGSRKAVCGAKILFRSLFN